MRPVRPPSPFTAAPIGPRDWRDAVLVSEEDLAAAAGEVVLDVLAVWVRRGGTWWPAVVTGWRQIRPGYWAARLQAGARDEPSVWVHYKGVAIAPVMPQVGDPTGAPAGTGR
ncbi:hypothetical protein [Streptomyces sp. NRRL B-24484]|uniref:hypothetical protein n=1 Tax=Streptomyces sp. NRRL B-24484 TaxID=1463833 RepID=UPI0004BF1404|nr:hypothetical protein [Streptomyces sp. NRRL B-24484]